MTGGTFEAGDQRGELGSELARVLERDTDALGIAL